MNDLVPSRTQNPRYMAQCDVVFFLSRASQFLDQSDMDLLARQLPGNGVKRMVLVACWTGPFQTMVLTASRWPRPRPTCPCRGGGPLVKWKSWLPSDRRGDSAIAAMLRTFKAPILASTFAHGFAVWEPAQWNSAMRHVHQELADCQRQLARLPLTPQDWQRIGNFARPAGGLPKRTPRQTGSAASSSATSCCPKPDASCSGGCKPWPMRQTAGPNG